MHGIPRLRSILRNAPLGDMRAPETHPGETVAGDALENFVRKGCATAYHPVGTVAMGDDAPLDAKLSLRGVTGLTVADASVMPKVTSANTNAPSMMIGWRAGGFVAARSKASKEAA
jgi:choline dehydrogenase-like flavoprotein